MAKSTAERRAKFRVGLHPIYVPLYDGICADLGPEWAPYYGKRSFLEQDQLFLQGRDPKTLAVANRAHVVTNARAGESAHNWGCASDWTLWGDDGAPIWLSRKDPRWKPFQEVLDKHGLRWGGDWNGNGISEEGEWDFFHNELAISAPWRAVLEHYQKLKRELLREAAAFDGAMRFIERLARK